MGPSAKIHASQSLFNQRRFSSCLSFFQILELARWCLGLVLFCRLRQQRGKSGENISKTSQELRMLSPVTLYWRLTMNVEIVVLNCQKCKQCFNGLKSLGLLFVIVFLIIMVNGHGHGHPSRIKCFCAPSHQIWAKSAPQKARNRNKTIIYDKSAWIIVFFYCFLSFFLCFS